MADFAGRLEDAARACISARTIGDRRKAERGFAVVLELLGPRMARLAREYGFADMPDDARQACAIGIHRALESYQPGKARFTTHATWQMRGELQSLRHRMRPEQRQGARNAGVRMVSTEAPGSGAWEVVDEDAVARVQSGAREALAIRSLEGLLENSGQSESERELVVAHVFDRPRPPDFARHSSEQCRQIVRRNLRHCARVVDWSRIQGIR